MRIVEKNLIFTLLYPPRATLEDLSEVRGALFEARAKWYDIGIELKVSIGTLNTIREDFPHAAHCLREMCINWLKRIDPSPSWAALAKALESPPVGEGHLAQQLRDKYCRRREEAKQLVTGRRDIIKEPYHK